MADSPEHAHSEPVAPFPRFSFEDLRLDVKPVSRARRGDSPQDAGPASTGVLVAEPERTDAEAAPPPAPVDPPAGVTVPPPVVATTATPARVAAPIEPAMAAAVEVRDVETLAAEVAGPTLMSAETESMSELRALLTSLRRPMPPFGEYVGQAPVQPPVAEPVSPVPVVVAPAPINPAPTPAPPSPVAAPVAPAPVAPAPARPVAPVPVAPAPAPPAVATRPADVFATLESIPAAAPDLSTDLPPIVFSEPAAAVSPAAPVAVAPASVAATPVASAGDVVPATGGMPVAVVASSAGARPALSQATLFVPQRPAAPHPVSPMLVVAPAPTLRKKKRKRGAIRTLFSFIVIVGILGGAAFAAKRYILDIDKWDTSVKAVAEDVAETRGLQFKDPVLVVRLPVDEYSTRLSQEALGLAFVDQPSRAPELRAVGLLQGDLDLVDVGQTAMIDMSAFYSPADKKILIADLTGLGPASQRFALSRALAQALLDQHFNWSEKVATSTASVAFGIRALVDGDALSVASTMLPTGDAVDIVTDQLNLIQQYGYTTNSPYLAAAAGRAGVVMAPTFQGIRNDPVSADELLTARIASDGAVLDLVRGLGGETIDPAIGPGETMGLAYWYYVLAGRLDDQQAWLAATSWAGDTTTVSANSGGVCVNSTIAAYTDGGAVALKAAFDSWVAAGPLEARATVELLENNRVAVMSCDPGTTAITMAEGTPMAFGGAPVERALASTVVPDPSEAVGAPVCLALQARFRNLPYSLPDDQSPLLGLAGGWKAPYVTGNADLATLCLAPPAAPAPEG